MDASPFTATAVLRIEATLIEVVRTAGDVSAGDGVGSAAGAAAEDPHPASTMVPIRGNHPNGHSRLPIRPRLQPDGCHHTGAFLHSAYRNYCYVVSPAPGVGATKKIHTSHRM